MGKTIQDLIDEETETTPLHMLIAQNLDFTARLVRMAGDYTSPCEPEKSVSSHDLVFAVWLNDLTPTYVEWAILKGSDRLMLEATTAAEHSVKTTAIWCRDRAHFENICQFFGDAHVGRPHESSQLQARLA